MRVIDKEVFGAIQSVSDEFGGLIGGSRFVEQDPALPACAIGALQYRGVLPMDPAAAGVSVYFSATELGVEDAEFDVAYRELRRERGLYFGARIPFADIAARAGWSASI
jgi:hypothetical protein